MRRPRSLIAIELSYVAFQSLLPNASYWIVTKSLPVASLSEPASQKGVTRGVYCHHAASIIVKDFL